MRNRWLLATILATGLAFTAPAMAQHEPNEMQHEAGYTCTMHPEIHADKPGDCPICGMTLVLEKSEATAFEAFTEGWMLQELEQMALSRNPAIPRAAADLQAAAGEAVQAGLYPNPTIGFQLEELSQRDPNGNTHEHLFVFGEQTILLGGKSGKARDVAQKDVQIAEVRKDGQQLQVLARVRSIYYQLLGAQYRIRVQEQLHKLTSEAASITRELYNVGQADRPDVLEAEIEAHSAELGLAEARSHRDALWKQMAAALGDADMPLKDVSGRLDQDTPNADHDALLSRLLAESPDVKEAEQRLQQKQTRIGYEKSRRIPNLTFRGGVGYNFEPLQDSNKAVGIEGYVEVALPLPLFNRNQGDLQTAQAQSLSAEHELRRIKLDLSARFSTVYAEYARAKSAAHFYRTKLLPRAEEAYNLYMSSFRQMAAAYPQVLIAQRNQYQLQVQYVDTLVNLWKSAQQMENLLME